MLDGATPRWSDLQAMARLAEDVGFDSLWFPDHVLARFPTGTYGAWECWSMLAALAVVTRRVALGPLVSCVGFRNPALLAKMADTVDEISGGRLILGLGAGWNQVEYDAFGWPFDHRASRFEEALTIIHALLHEGYVDFAGQYFQARECALQPRGPRARRLPIMVGTRGERMLRLTARLADSWNTDWVLPRNLPSQLEAVDAACAAVGRDPATLERTAAVRVELPGVQHYPLDTYRGQFSGSVEELAALLRAYADAGIAHLQIWLIPGTAASIEAIAPVLDLLDQG
jgi:probable F420-dependent oxidoreductase